LPNVLLKNKNKKLYSRTKNEITFTIIVSLERNSRGKYVTVTVISLPRKQTDVSFERFASDRSTVKSLSTNRGNLRLPHVLIPRSQTPRWYFTRVLRGNTITFIAHVEEFSPYTYAIWDFVFQLFTRHAVRLIKRRNIYFCLKKLLSLLYGTIKVLGAYCELFSFRKKIVRNNLANTFRVQ